MIKYVIIDNFIFIPNNNNCVNWSKSKYKTVTTLNSRRGNNRHRKIWGLCQKKLGHFGKAKNFAGNKTTTKIFFGQNSTGSWFSDTFEGPPFWKAERQVWVVEGVVYVSHILSRSRQRQNCFPKITGPHFLHGPILASFSVYFRLLNLNWWWAWDSNPGWLGGRHNRIHWATAAPPLFSVFYFQNNRSKNNCCNKRVIKLFSRQMR